MRARKRKTPLAVHQVFISNPSKTGCRESFGKTIQTSAGGSVGLNSFNDAIRIVHTGAHYNCCAEIQTHLVKVRLGLDPFEIDQGDTCKRMRCPDLTTLVCDTSDSTFLIRVGL